MEHAFIEGDRVRRIDLMSGKLREMIYVVVRMDDFQNELGAHVFIRPESPLAQNQNERLVAERSLELV